jgi:hypothetical protein
VANKPVKLSPRRAPDLRRVAATVIGWVILAILAWFLLGAVIGTIRWVVRMVVLAAVLVGLIWAYAKLRTPRR